MTLTTVLMNPVKPLAICLPVLVLLLGVGQAKAGMLGPLVITEVSPHTPDFFEIQNVSADVVDTSGWFVALNDSLLHDINSMPATLSPLPSSLLADEIFWRHDDVSGLYYPNYYIGYNIPWNTRGPGWAMIVDDEGQAADFVIWGYTEEEMALLDLDFGGGSITIDDIWSGEAIPIPPPEFPFQSHPRIGNADHDDVSDWEWDMFGNYYSPGSANTGLETPFVPEPSTMLLLATAAFGFAAYGWRTRRRRAKR